VLILFLFISAGFLDFYCFYLFCLRVITDVTGFPTVTNMILAFNSSSVRVAQLALVLIDHLHVWSVQSYSLIFITRCITLLKAMS